jgi:hypothetical protein
VEFGALFSKTEMLDQMACLADTFGLLNEYMGFNYLCNYNNVVLHL